MKSFYFIALALALAMSGAILSASGFTAIIGEERHSQQLSDKVVETGNKSVVAQDGGFGSDFTGIIGIVLAAGSYILTVAKILVLLPLELNKLGLPSWFAYTVGSSIQILGGIGFLQFVAGRVLR